MRKHFSINLAGQEVEVDDLNSISQNAAEAEDRALAELLRMTPYIPGGVARGILPYGTRDWVPAYGDQRTRVVSITGLTDGRVYVHPFRAFVGSRAADFTDADTKTAWQRDIRSAMLVGPSSANGKTAVQLGATVANNRWDLIYVRVDADVSSGAAMRYVKAIDGTEGAQSLSLYKVTTCTIGVQQGAEATTPALPTIPADTSTAFYIPLAYVLLRHPFTTGTGVGIADIRDCAPILGVAPAVGGVDARPASWTNAVGGALPAWTPSGGRPREFIPSTMTGLVTRYFGLDFAGGHASIPLNATTVLDDSIDWRKRLFRVHMQALDLVGTQALAWTGTASPIPGAGVDGTAAVLGSSFHQNSAITGGAVVAYMNPVSLPVMGGGSSVQIYVDMADGKLKALTSTNNPDTLLFCWIDASGPFTNVSNSFDATDL